VDILKKTFRRKILTQKELPSNGRGKQFG